MALSTSARLDAAIRLCRAVIGDEYCTDYERITGIGVGVREPGYGDDETVWVLGNWNDRCDYSTGERVVTDNRWSRLFDALERIGVQGEWLDEWHVCAGCEGIVRSQPDSYFWSPSYVMVADEILCHECAGDDLETVLDVFIGDANKCVTAWASAGDLEEHGFVRWNEPPFENGWHPGQDDNPHDIAARFESENPGAEWLFYLDENSQFYSRFSLFYRSPELD